MSLRARALVRGMRVIAKPYLRRVQAAPKARGSLDRVARLTFHMPPRSVLLPDCLSVDGRNPVRALWAHGVSPKPRGVILFLHGGGYVAGSAMTHAGMVVRLAQGSGLRAVLPNYRLAPDAPFPAAVDDALTAWLALLDRGYEPRDIALGGDSAGGGLAAALLGQIADKGLGMPGRVFLMSPWSDLTLSGSSLSDNAQADPLLPANRIKDLRAMYLGNAAPDDPRASPIFARFTGCGPVLIQVGAGEILLSDSQSLADAMRRDGVEVRLDVWPGLPHVWHLFQGHLPEADQALSRISDFLDGIGVTLGDASPGCAKR